MSRTARQTAAAVEAGELTAEAVVHDCLESIEASEPQVQAWKHLAAQSAIAAARALDRGPRRGMLHGVPLAVKDVTDTSDMPTGYGSELYEGFRPAADAACVALVRAAGAIVIGKTVTTEFAFVAPGKTRNPFNPSHTPGGSSSGSAAAVGAGMLPLAFGTQTAGSVIRPASFCGAVGYKPSFGLIDRTGVKTLATNFDTVGLVAADVADAALLVAAAADRPGLTTIAPISSPRLGLYRTPMWHRAGPGTASALERAIRALERAGAKVVEVDDVPGAETWFDLHETIMEWDVLHAFSFERLFHLEKLAAPTRDRLISFQERASAERYQAALAAKAEACSTLFPRLIGDCDALLTPAAPDQAPAGLDSTGDALFNKVWTMLHVPCLTVPTGPGPGGLPVGVQLVGRNGEDARTLAVAAFAEAALQ